MTGRNKTPLLGWHPPAELSAWVRDRAAKEGVPLSSVLNRAVYALQNAIAEMDARRAEADRVSGSPSEG